MADSNLILSKTDLEGEIGSFLGWSRGANNGEVAWSARKQRDIDSIIKSGQARFYTKAQLEPTGPVYQWTFLTPSASVNLRQSDQFADLPEDFGYLVGEVSVTTGKNNAYWPIKLDNIDRIRMLYQRNLNQTGRPYLVALDELHGTTLDRSSRGRLWVYPRADTNYTLQFSYSVIPSLISTSNPFPYGGAAHAETFKASCRAAAELYLDNEPGPEEMNYRICLAASIAYDRRRKPQTMAYNGDRSDVLDMNWGYGVRDRNWWGHLTMPTASIGGLDPT